MEETRRLIRESQTLKGPFPSFDPKLAGELPQELFLEWFQDAIDFGVHEPHAMTLSTTDHFGLPDTRILILKDVDEHGWYFASSSNSGKGKQLKENPHIALTFYWSGIGRQVRIRGKALEMGLEKNASDFLLRGKVARAIVLMDKQSSIMDRPEEFEEHLKYQLDRLIHDPGLVSPSWTLYRVAAAEVEFWQGHEDRKHTRLKYTLNENKWIRRLLWP